MKMTKFSYFPQDENIQFWRKKKKFWQAQFPHASNPQNFSILQV